MKAPALVSIALPFIAIGLAVVLVTNTFSTSGSNDSRRIHLSADQSAPTTEQGSPIGGHSPDPADFPPPGPDDAIVALDESDLAEPATANAASEIAASLDAERRARLANGQRQIAEQRQALVEALPALEGKSLRVVATFAKPIPLSLFNEQQQSLLGTLNAEETLITAYGEMADGYPITVWGPPSMDLGTAISSASQNVATVRRSGQQIPESDVVVLGYNAPYDAFASVESEARSRADLAAVEVSESLDANPMLLLE